jgi:toluene monooxygenase electron transfer component
VGDCTIKGRVADTYVSRHPPRRAKASLEATRDITHDIREFSCRVDGGANFLAGQYAMLTLSGFAAHARIRCPTLPTLTACGSS